MTKEFTPTKKQSEALAKVAGVKTKEAGIGGIICYLVEDGGEITSIIWQPHKSRNQIALILEGMSEGQEAVFFQKMMREFLSISGITARQDFTIWALKLPAHISCRIICETLNLEE